MIESEITAGYKCDICGKYTEFRQRDWFNFSVGHSEWDNDSCDSYEYYDVCSPECYIIALKNILIDFKEYYSTEIHGDMNISFFSNLVEYINNRG